MNGLRGLGFLFGFLFLVSGIPAVIYQIAWQRLLGLFAGVGHFSITIIVASFMAGLGAGSLVAGMRADRMSRTASLCAFAVCELLISLFAFISPTLLYDLLFVQLGGLARYQSLMPIILFAFLVLPTGLMGASLPLLARGLVPDVPSAGRAIGVLYALNTIGGGIGGLLAAYLLMPNYGIDGTIYCAAILNAAIGVVALIASRKRYASFDPAISPKKNNGEIGASSKSSDKFEALRWSTLAGIAGFMALALEILWFRVLWVAVKANPQTFGNCLGILLLFIGIGSLTGSILLSKIPDHRRAFLWCQWMVSITAIVPLAWLIHGNADDGYLGGLLLYWSGSHLYGPEYLNIGFARIHIVLPVIVMAPGGLLMGASFPLLQRILQTDTANVALRTGWILSAMIAGNILGALVAGFLLASTIGTPTGFVLITCIGSIFGFSAAVMKCRTAMRSNRRRLLAGGLVFAISAGSIAALSNDRKFWARFHGRDPAELEIFEDRLAVLARRDGLIAAENAGEVTVNGRFIAALPFARVHLRLGLVPVLIHPDPRDILVVGLGSGGVVWAASALHETESIEVCEILEKESELILQESVRGSSAINMLLSDSRVKWQNIDGRLSLRIFPRLYDIIEIDLTKDAPYNGNLTSKEFYENARRRLKPGGILCTSGNYDQSMFNAAVQVFTYTAIVEDVVLFSNRPIEFDTERMHGRITRPSVVSYFMRGGFEIRELIGSIPFADHARGRVTDEHRKRASREMNRDLFPREEFRLNYPDL